MPEERYMYEPLYSESETVDAIETAITRRIVMKEEDAYFALLADETSDVARMEQLSIALRYVNANNDVNEKFLGFFEVRDVSGKGIAERIMRVGESVDLPMDRLVGLGFDGAAATFGKMNGAQAVISRKYPQATYVHCSAHVLNLVLVKASESARY